MIVFHALEKEHLKEIVSYMAQSLTNRLKEQNIELQLTPAALDKIAEEGNNPQPFVFANADADEDGTITVSDITATATIILTK